MAYYKLCECGTKNYFEQRGSSPRKCDNCNRSLFGFSVMDEEAVGYKSNDFDLTVENTDSFREEHTIRFTLESMDGKQKIEIPYEGCSIGRASHGSEFLQNKKSVSREHIVVKYWKMGLLVEDISKFGTYVDDRLILKNSPMLVLDGQIVRLYNIEFRVRKHREGD
jgi:hypothetical protein